MLRHHRQCEACGKVAEARSKPTGWHVREGPRGERADICGAHDGDAPALLPRYALDRLWLEHWTGHVGPA